MIFEGELVMAVTEEVRNNTEPVTLSAYAVPKRNPR